MFYHADHDSMGGSKGFFQGTYYPYGFKILELQGLAFCRFLGCSGSVLGFRV